MTASLCIKIAVALCHSTSWRNVRSCYSKNVRNHFGMQSLSGAWKAVLYMAMVSSAFWVRHCEQNVVLTLVIRKSFPDFFLPVSILTAFTPRQHNSNWSFS